MKTSAKGVKLICDFEGFRAKAYLDPVGIPTIGFGFIFDVSLGDVTTLFEAQQRLQRELITYEKGVLAACQVKPSQNAFDALVCFAFNVGVKGMTGSSVIKAHNRGDTQSAARAFGLWNKADGKIFAGLTRRRAAEASLYLEPVPDDVSDPVEGAVLPMPQKVDPETPMAASPINRASVIAGATAALASASEIVGAVNTFKRGLGELQDWAIPLLLVATVVAAGVVVWQRWRQRRGGWA